MLAACQMLDHVGKPELATRIQQAIEATLREQQTVTRDIGGTANTAAFTDAVIAKL